MEVKSERTGIKRLIRLKVSCCELSMLYMLGMRGWLGGSCLRSKAYFNL